MSKNNKTLIIILIAVVIVIAGVCLWPRSPKTETTTPVASLPPEAAPGEATPPTSTSTSSLPPFVLYNGYPHEVAVADYLLANVCTYFDPSDVCIPNLNVVATDLTDEQEAKVWGAFEVYQYKLNGDILETVSGGSFPGMITLRPTDTGYEAVDMENVADGSGFTASAQAVFGEHYDDFMAVYGNQEEREAHRAATIRLYVGKNNLPIRAYQDYGWDPVEL